MLNRSASLAMSTSVLKALPGKLDIKRHSPSILYLLTTVPQPVASLTVRFLFIPHHPASILINEGWEWRVLVSFKDYKDLICVSSRDRSFQPEEWPCWLEPRLAEVPISKVIPREMILFSKLGFFENFIGNWVASGNTKNPWNDRQPACLGGLFKDTFVPKAKY